MSSILRGNGKGCVGLAEAPEDVVVVREMRLELERVLAAEVRLSEERGSGTDFFVARVEPSARRVATTARMFAVLGVAKAGVAQADIRIEGDFLDAGKVLEHAGAIRIGCLAGFPSAQIQFGKALATVEHVREIGASGGVPSTGVGQGGQLRATFEHARKVRNVRHIKVFATFERFEVRVVAEPTIAIRDLNLLSSESDNLDMENHEGADLADALPRKLVFVFGNGSRVI